MIMYFFALITKEGFLISPCYSLELCVQMVIFFFFSFAFHFSSFTAIFKALGKSLIPCLFQLPEATGILWLMESFLFLHLQNQHPCISLTVLPQSHLFLTKAEKFSSVQSLSRVQLFATLRTPACQASLSITNPQSHSDSRPSSQ